VTLTCNGRLSRDIWVVLMIYGKTRNERDKEEINRQGKIFPLKNDAGIW